MEKPTDRHATQQTSAQEVERLWLQAVHLNRLVTAAASYRGNEEQLAPHQVEHPDGARTVGVGQQGAVVAPGYPPPVGAGVFRDCGERDTVQSLSPHKCSFS